MKQSSIHRWWCAGQPASLRLTLGIVLATGNISARAVRECDSRQAVTTAVAPALLLTWAWHGHLPIPSRLQTISGNQKGKPNAD